MFKIFQGFHLVEAYQKKKKERRLSDDKTVSRIIRLLIPIFVSLVVWLMPTESFGIEGLTLVEQRVMCVCNFDVGARSHPGMDYFGGCGHYPVAYRFGQQSVAFP